MKMKMKKEEKEKRKKKSRWKDKKKMREKKGGRERNHRAQTGVPGFHFRPRARRHRSNALPARML